MPDWSEKTDPSTTYSEKADPSTTSTELADKARTVTTNIFLDTDDCVFMDTSNNEWIDAVLTYALFTEQTDPSTTYSEKADPSTTWSEKADPS